MTAGRPKRQPPPADVEVGATARAKRIRFRSKPEARVEFSGESEPGVESDSHTERENLPDEVEPGKVYRDVKVSWVAGARIDDEEVQGLVDELAARSNPKGARDNSKES